MVMLRWNKVQPLNIHFLMQEVVHLLKNGPVCPDSALAVQRYLQEHHPDILQDS